MCVRSPEYGDFYAVSTHLPPKSCLYIVSVSGVIAAGKNFESIKISVSEKINDVICLSVIFSVIFPERMSKNSKSATASYLVRNENSVSAVVLVNVFGKLRVFLDFGKCSINVFVIRFYEAVNT